MPEFLYQLEQAKLAYLYEHPVLFWTLVCAGCTLYVGGVLVKRRFGRRS
jgi:hypothetical protein